LTQANHAKGNGAKIGVERTWVIMFDQRINTNANDGSNFGGKSGKCDGGFVR
jgi:hypothetical protein